MEHPALESGRKQRVVRKMVDRGTGPVKAYRDILEENRLLFQELCLNQAELETRNDELRRLKDDLGQANDRFFDLYNRAPMGCCTITANGLILEANRTAAVMLQVEREALIGQPLSRFVHPQDRDAFSSHCQRISTGGPPGACELRMIRPDQTICWIHLALVVDDQPAGDRQGCRVAMSEITARKQAEEARKQSEQRAHEAKNLLKLVLDTIPVRLFWKDLTSAYLGCNHLFARDAGFEVPEELIGLDDYAMVWKEQADRYREDDFEVMVSGNPKLHYEELQTTPEGKQIWLSTSKVPIRDATGAIIGVLGVYDDITSRKRAEEELLKVQHLEALGSLAGGVAHDFNNILMITMGYISFAKDLLAPTDRGHELLTLAEESILKAKELTRQFLTFSQGGSPITRLLSIDKLIKMYSHFALSQTRSTCELVTSDDLWPVEADEGQIGQVLTNILINADQAMAEGGTIAIGCENAVVAEEDSLPLAAGQYVRISIRDRGRGIAREYLDKVFDPYFTTRETGCGLGLASAYSIMKKHGGHIAVESVAGEGSTFTLFLPASPPTVPTTAIAVSAVRYGNGKILVMANDALVLKILGTILGTLGYVAEFAGDREQTLEKYREARQSGWPFDVVLMDVMAPEGREGKETVADLLAVDPQAKVIVASGYHDDSIGSDYARHGFSGVITKPYRLSELNRRIRQVLHGAS